MKIVDNQRIQGNNKTFKLKRCDKEREFIEKAKITWCDRHIEGNNLKKKQWWTAEDKRFLWKMREKSEMKRKRFRFF